MNRLLACLVCSASVLAAWARADGLIQKLPEDGSWAKYRLELTIGASEGERRVRSSVTIRSVGKLQEKGEKCRWIEIAFDGPHHRSIAKLLVPEKELAKGKDCLAAMVRGWWIDGGASAAQPLANPEKRPFLPALAGGPLADAKPIETKTVDVPQLGKIETAGVIGTRRQELDQLVIESRQELRFSDKTPFGGVSIRGEFVGKRDGVEQFTGQFTIDLVDTGKDAKSELPDANGSD